jgi:hypothetical protein
MSKTIKIKDIAIDGGTQQREKINEEIVSEYAEAMRCGAKFPPVTLFFDGVQYWLADGFHRFHASRAAEMLDILADVREGTKRDAVLFSASANGTHGMRLSNADKRKSVLVLLLDKEWSKWSDNQIAKHCHVTHPFVGKLRKEIEPNGVVTVTTHASKPNNDAGTVSELPKKEAEQDSASETEELRAHIEELTATAKELLEENASMGAVMDADDKLAALTAENKKLRELNRVLNERIQGLQGECNEAKRAAKMWRAKFDKLEKQSA